MAACVRALLNAGYVPHICVCGGRDLAAMHTKQRTVLAPRQHMPLSEPVENDTRFWQERCGALFLNTALSAAVNEEKPQLAGGFPLHPTSFSHQKHAKKGSVPLAAASVRWGPGNSNTNSRVKQTPIPRVPITPCYCFGSRYRATDVRRWLHSPMATVSVLSFVVIKITVCSLKKQTSSMTME